MTGIQWGAIVSCAALVVTIVTAAIRSFNKLSCSMIKLDTTMDLLAKQFEKTDETLCEHGKKLYDHETRITVIEREPSRPRRTQKGNP
ncbi:MAG: hypothetical protein ABFC31_07090 [Clostridiaceae bacterium]